MSQGKSKGKTKKELQKVIDQLKIDIKNRITKLKVDKENEIIILKFKPEDFNQSLIFTLKPIIMGLQKEGYRAHIIPERIKLGFASENQILTTLNRHLKMIKTGKRPEEIKFNFDKDDITFNPENFQFQENTNTEHYVRYKNAMNYYIYHYPKENVYVVQKNRTPGTDVIYNGKIPTNEFAVELFSYLGIVKKFYNPEAEQQIRNIVNFYQVQSETLEDDIQTILGQIEDFKNKGTIMTKDGIANLTQLYFKVGKYNGKGTDKKKHVENGSKEVKENKVQQK